MGCLITAHIFRDKPEFSRLAELPKSIGYRVYSHRAAGILLLDAFRSARLPAYPFQTLLPSSDISLDLPRGLEVLERLYSLLEELNLVDGFNKSYINAVLLLHRLLELPVFSFVSDDDELDFTCSASNGVLSRLKCRCGDLLISYADQKLQIAPLVPEFAEEEVLLSDVESLRVSLPEAEILPRETKWNNQLHSIAIRELQTFAGIEGTILGLGSPDPPEDESDWELIASR